MAWAIRIPDDQPLWQYMTLKCEKGMAKVYNIFMDCAYRVAAMLTMEANVYQGGRTGSHKLIRAQREKLPLDKTA